MASIAQTVIQIGQLVKRVIDLINLSNENSKHIKEIKSRMLSISGIVERLSKLPDADREDLERSIGGVSETLEEVEGFVLSRMKKPKDGRFSKIAKLWHRGNSIYNAESIKDSLAELDHKMQLHLQILCAAQGQAQLKRQVEMAETLKSLSSSMFAFSLPAPGLVLPAALQAPPAPPFRWQQRGRDRFALRASETGSVSKQPSASPRGSTGSGMPRATGPTRTRSQQTPAAGRTFEGTPTSLTGRPLTDDQEAGPDLPSEASDSDSEDLEKPQRPIVVPVPPPPQISPPLVREPSILCDTDTENDFILLNSYDNRQTLYAVTKYLEIAAHQFIIGTFICACAMLNSDKAGRICVLVLAPCFPVLVMFLLMVQAKTISNAIIVFGFRSLMDKAFLTYTLYGWPCWAALGGLAANDQLEGQPGGSFQTCLYGVTIGVFAYLTGRFLTTPTVTAIR